jgi:hypothetical protein
MHGAATVSRVRLQLCIGGEDQQLDAGNQYIFQEHFLEWVVGAPKRSMFLPFLKKSTLFSRNHGG